MRYYVLIEIELILTNILLDNKEKSIFSFIIRDSPEDFINVNIWGSMEYVQHLYDNFKIGDVGK